MTPLFRKALLMADEVRIELGLDMFEPINIYDACIDLQITVRFVDISMEGMYVINNNGTNPTIILSNKRPMPRRVYTCAHELGHHRFKHGNRIDHLKDPSANHVLNDPDEFLVDVFAGALLMPVAGVQAEFAKRGWAISKATPIQFYTISSVFGTGFRTLIVHSRANGLINSSKAEELLKTAPAKLLTSLSLQLTDNSYFKIIDQYSKLPVIDLEVGNYILLPNDIIVHGGHLVKLKVTSTATGYKATKPGIIRVCSPNGTIASFIRIQNEGYVGLAEYRHLECITD